MCVRGSLRTRDICNRPHIRSTKPPEYDNLTHHFTTTKLSQTVQKESAWTPQCRTAHRGTYRIDRSVDSGEALPPKGPNRSDSVRSAGTSGVRFRRGRQLEVTPSHLLACITHHAYVATHLCGGLPYTHLLDRVTHHTHTTSSHGNITQPGVEPVRETLSAARFDSSE